eukprot:TRINITY_DN36538_c0_g1_i2.p1 TRINITY_DN36538_c0_g1~~TRINITY_DN36538_c0_g1_i2.p1  ORF type:complete len:205 (+),score=54.81 TRINITY_DN36538_c0_g1_i2:88-702(+)
MSIQPLDYAQWYTVSNFLRFYSGHEGVVTLVFSEGMVRPIASMDIDAWMIFSTMCSHPTNLANAPPAEEGEQDDADPDDRQPLTAVEGNVEQMWPNEAFARPVRKGTGKSKGMSSSCKAKAMPSKSKGSGKDKDKDKDNDKDNDNDNDKDKDNDNDKDQDRARLHDVCRLRKVQTFTKCVIGEIEKRVPIGWRRKNGKGVWAGS